MPSRVRGDESFVAMMSNGTSGDINNIPFGVTRPPREPFEQIRIVAQKGRRHRVARAAEDREASLRRPPRHDPARGHAEVSPAHAPSRSRRRRPCSPSRTRTPSRSCRASRRTTPAAPSPPPSARRTRSPCRLQAIRIGDLAVCGIPFETFVEIGLDLKKRSPFPQTMVIGLANGRHGYLPTPEQHKLGGYETWLGTNCRAGGHARSSSRTTCWRCWPS